MSKSKEKEEKKFKLQDFIKSNDFGFFISLCAVIFQALHTQYNLKSLSSLSNVYGFDLSQHHAMGLAAIISMAILYFTLRKRFNKAIGWAVFEAYMNICYYVIYIESQPVPPRMLYFIAIPVSFALPTILGMFSKELLYDGEGNITYEDSKELKKLILEQGEIIDKKILNINTMNEVEKEGLQDDIKKANVFIEKLSTGEFSFENIDTGSVAHVKMKP